jgi:hypothetical protein
MRNGENFMTHYPHAKLTLAIAAIVSCNFNGALAAPKAAELLPATTKAYVATSDIHRLDSDWKKTRLAGIFADEKMRPFLDAAKQVQQDAAAGDAPAALVTWDDLLGISAGSVTAAIVAVEKTKPASILLVDSRGKRKQVAELMSRLSEMYAKLGAKRIDRTIANQRVVAYEFEARTDKPHKAVHYYFLRDDVFGAADSAPLLADIFGRWNGGAADSLEKLASFESIRRRSNNAMPKDSARAEWFLDPFGFQALIGKADGKLGSDAWQIAMRQGFAGIGAVGGALSFSAGQFEVVHQLAIYAPAPLAKTARMLAFQPLGDVRLPGWVAADVGRAAILKWNISEAFAAYGSWFDEVYGEGETGIFEEVVLGIRDDPGSPGVDIR